MKHLSFLLLLIITIIHACNNSPQPVADKELDPGIADDYSDLTDIHNYKEWGVYNVHDPAGLKADDGFFYIYSTDAIYWPRGAVRRSDTIQTGNIQIRRSKDLVHWEFVGWALDSIPDEAVQHIIEASGDRRPRGIWAPCILKWNNEYRLYYSVSVFGANTSCIGLAVAPSPTGPWEHRGLVVKTFKHDPVNAIDPSVITDQDNGRHWMHYGSYFGGLSALELEPETGLALQEGDLGKIVARRSEGRDKIIEAPEIIYQPEMGKYYLFVSYEPLFTHYNVRVGRSDNPEGPFLDIFGQNMAEPENNYPVITYAYRFRNHPGWAGTGHCGILQDEDDFFMVHQGRLAPDNQMMVLHTRKVYWTDEGWPVVAPERYAGVPQTKIRKRDIPGKWEILSLHQVRDSVLLWQGQIPPGGWHYDTLMFNNSEFFNFTDNGLIEEMDGASWKLSNNQLVISPAEDAPSQTLILSRGWDWENSRSTLLLTGLSEKGIGIWGKQVR